jgi:hypothetical protein
MTSQFEGIGHLGGSLFGNIGKCGSMEVWE